MSETENRQVVNPDELPLIILDETSIHSGSSVY